MWIHWCHCVLKVFVAVFIWSSCRMMIYVPFKKDIIMNMSNIDQVPSASVCSWFYHGYVANSWNVLRCKRKLTKSWTYGSKSQSQQEHIQLYRVAILLISYLYVMLFCIVLYWTTFFFFCLHGSFFPGKNSNLWSPPTDEAKRWSIDDERGLAAGPIRRMKG